MPYKDPENANANGNENAAALRSARKPVTDPVSDQKPKNGWKTIDGFAVGLGVVLLASFIGTNLPIPGDLRASRGPGNPAI